MVFYLIPRELPIGRYESKRLSSSMCVNCSNYQFFYNIYYIAPIFLYMATKTTYTHYTHILWILRYNI